LTDGQAVMIYATAVMGTADKHVKWQVCNGVGYSYLPVIDVDPKKADDEDVVEAAKVCPKHVYTVEDGKLVVKDGLSCNLCMSCVEAVGRDRGLSVSGDDTNFVFKFETDGSLTARQALDKAVEILTAEAEDFKAQIEAL
ncbi:MAG: DNA-directed RNA polymerase subunit D, partial [Thermoplasmata archaeon]|nr:DNA-directed RNA polymerase subunit D [Thermoplasmata archaeon]